MLIDPMTGVQDVLTNPLAVHASRGAHINVVCKGEYIQIHRPDALVKAMTGVAATSRNCKRSEDHSESSEYGLDSAYDP